MIKSTQYALILNEFQKNPNLTIMVKDAVKLIGYEAGTRLSDLKRKGLLFVCGKHEKFSIYAITDLGLSVNPFDIKHIKTKKGESKIRSQERPEELLKDYGYVVPEKTLIEKVSLFFKKLLGEK